MIEFSILSECPDAIAMLAKEDQHVPISFFSVESVAIQIL